MTLSKTDKPGVKASLLPAMPVGKVVEMESLCIMPLIGVVQEKLDGCVYSAIVVPL